MIRMRWILRRMGGILVLLPRAVRVGLRLGKGWIRWIRWVTFFLYFFFLCLVDAQALVSTDVVKRIVGYHLFSNLVTASPGDCSF